MGAGLDTVTAPDACTAVRSFIDCNIKLTDMLADSTRGTCLLVYAKPIQGDVIKKAIDSA